MIRVDIDDTALRDWLDRLDQRTTEMRPLFAKLGEAFIDSTKQRFKRGQAPDGSYWPPNTEVTYLLFLDKFSSTGKRGRLNRSGRNLAMGKRPLIGESKRLSTEIFYQATNAGLELGSALEYAAVQQFGYKQGASGKTTKRGSPIPYGDIPARPYLGLSDDDTALALQIIGDYLLDD